MCQAVRPLAVHAQAAARRVASIEEALTSTSNRLGSAAAAGDQSDTALQEAAFDALDGELVPLLRAQNAADGALAGKLRRERVKLVFKQSAMSKGIASILEQAAVGGVSKSELEAISGDELDATAFNYASSLQPVSTAAPSELDRSISVSGLAAIFAALDTQKLIPAKQHAKLQADLKAAGATSSAATRRAKLRAFITTAKTIPGQAGQLLVAAAQPLS